MRTQVLTPWMYRRWRFDFPSDLFPAVLERLRGTPARLAEFCAGLDDGVIGFVPEDGWSIKRHVGHMGDLESLLATRLDAYERADHALPAADMGNERTVDADHDGCVTQALLDRFREVRSATMQRLDAYPRDFFARSAWHERLGVQKRVVDTCVFFADHDDHHAALMRHVAQVV